MGTQLQTTNSAGNPTDYLTIKQFCKINPSFTAPQIAYWIFLNKNGIRRCVIKAGRRLILHIPSFLEWLESGRLERRTQDEVVGSSR